MTRPEPPYAIVAIASSAGGVTALGRVLSGIPAGIAHVLDRWTALPVRLARHGEIARPSSVGVAPPNRHLLVGEGGVLTLSDSERVHFVRPSADLLFESVAGTYGSRALACVLTGTGCDGAKGASDVKARGGTVIVEDPEHAEFKGMPEAAIAFCSVDFILPLDEIADVICALVETEI